MNEDDPAFYGRLASPHHLRKATHSSQDIFTAALSGELNDVKEFIDTGYFINAQDQVSDSSFFPCSFILFREDLHLYTLLAIMDIMKLFSFSWIEERRSVWSIWSLCFSTRRIYLFEVFRYTPSLSDKCSRQ
jgi:hypothetical protein